MHKSIIAAAGMFALGLAGSAQAQDSYLGQVIVVASDFCPRGTLETDGRLLQISRNPALFSLLGTRYGGDGRATFALPDLRNKLASANGRALLHCVATEGIFPSRS